MQADLQRLAAQNAPTRSLYRTLAKWALPLRATDAAPVQELRVRGAARAAAAALESGGPTLAAVQALLSRDT